MRATLFLLLILLIAGCREQNKPKLGATTQAKSSTAKEKPLDVPFPVYDYAGLAPLLNQKDGKTHIINFWATWCKPCVEELPDFERTFAEQKDNNVSMTLVSLDMPSMWSKRLVPFVKENDLKGNVVILDDPKMNDWIPKIDKDWGGGIPATLIYNDNKRAFYPHGFTYEELNKELLKFTN
ncbi:Alkyl hydroperoxide reductase/ Thiol specific antioxidant/ Mal allergen [Croceitalea dokdonensis DOKDO 023]|uniref:Alkyl hydroperoxide reductase/ Thiol specific antioxidant/ Mal allergen n=1 Tax=Croceitalea dokdonensis DOKDO 023 TaxID=1300341 RepID=A0A0P7AJ42_9FLAO|nr:TlpA disulfide reductase family protein [Croceitalea dokdonensis]KPM31814.1 Alkyl hydroperoxide reductase/ Thiol specific antioxidant/ Mal allergen [Croceitalea dokdonensis DOKDO 023]